MTVQRADMPSMSRFSPLIEGMSDTLAVLRSVGGPVVDLIARLWVAQVFLMSGVLKAANWQTTLLLYTYEHPVPGLAPATAAGIGTAIELLCPILLAGGALTRFATIPLLLTTAFLQFTYKDAIDHWLWIAWLGLFLVRGPGALSIDAVVGPHLLRSALPLVGAVQKLAGWLHRHVVPPYRVVLRAGIALLIVSAVSRLDEPVATAMVIAAAVCFAAGLATPLSGLILLACDMLLLGAMATTGDGFLGRLLLAEAIIGGGGALSVDRRLARTVMRLFPAVAGDPGWHAGAPRVVIVGAGFGGIAAARGLRYAWADVTLIDRRNYHLFQPLLYQVATASLSPADIATPIRGLVRNQQNCKVVMARVTGVDLETREVIAGDRRVAFDYLVLATGAKHSYFGKDAWEPFAPGLKKIDDATALRGRILTAFERAETSDDPEERQRLLTFVIIGGGPTGVELAGAIAELAIHGMQGEFRVLDPSMARVILVQSAPRLLPAMPEKLSADALASLAALGVDVRLGARVEHVDGDGVLIGSERVASRTVMWAAGVAASPAARWIGAARDNAGRAIVGTDLSVPGLENVFVLGDTAACPGAGGAALPGLAAVAKQQGMHVARLIRARIEGRKPTVAFRYRDYGSMATIGRKAAVADLPGLRLSGAAAWWLWSCVHVAFLADARSRMAVLFDWLWSYLTYNRSMRLITGAERDVE